ncbi:glycosyltransferase, partial [Candidatus Bathyarchaeota archaeon]|nr:glycosyltransferase [Candidatus Bathyarchaeota archaeon]
MKILQLVYAFYPYSTSGNSRVAYEISKELVRRGNDVTVFTTNVLEGETMFAPKMEEYNINGIKVHYNRNLIYKPNAFIPIFYSQGIIDKIRKAIIGYDVIHLHENRFYTSIFLHHYAKKYGIPYIMQAHGDLPRIGKTGIKLLYDQVCGYRILRDASKVIALTDIEAEQYANMGVSRKRIEIIPNGIDLSEYSHLPSKGVFREKFKISKNKKIILYLGRIHEIKGIDLLIKAYGYLSKNMKDDEAILVIAGPDDGYLGNVKSLISRLKLNNRILIIGSLYGEDKLEAYVDSNMYVLPSRYETFPMSVLEAYACGKPVIASMIGGLKHLVANELTGLLVEPGDV